MKRSLFLLLASMLIVGGLAAQAKTNSDIKVFALELGTGFGYDLATKGSSPTQTVATVFGLSDVVQAGFVIIKGDSAAHSFTLLKVAVFPLPDLGVNLLFGGDQTTPAPKITSGFGLGYNVFRNSSGSLTTALQVNVQYLFNDIANGNLGLGMNLKVGL